MTGDVIKSFLVGLGFEVDDSSLSKFNKAIATATVRVTALYTATNLLAAGIVKSISSISEDFEAMGYEYRLIQPQINKALLLRQELLKAYSAAGVNIVKVVQNSLKLNLSLTKTKFALEAIYKSVGSKFFTLLTKQSDIFRQKIYQNMPKIQAALEKFVNFIFKAFSAVTTLGERAWSILTRVYDFFVKLHEATSGWSTIILGVVAAWRLLNLSFLATPLGMLIGGLITLLALYDDFKTFQEGGKSFFNWSNAIPIINAVTDAVNYLKNAWLGLVDIVGNILLAFYQLNHSDTAGFLESLGNAGKSLLSIFSSLWEVLKGVGNAIASIGGTIGGGLRDLIANFTGFRGADSAIPSVAHLGAGGNQTNKNVTQNNNFQTSMNIVGSADANSTGNAAAGAMARNQQDLHRNLSGNVR